MVILGHWCFKHSGKSHPSRIIFTFKKAKPAIKVLFFILNDRNPNIFCSWNKGSLESSWFQKWLVPDTQWDLHLSLFYLCESVSFSVSLCPCIVLSVCLSAPLSLSPCCVFDYIVAFLSIFLIHCHYLSAFFSISLFLFASIFLYFSSLSLHVLSHLSLCVYVCVCLFVCLCYICF